MCVRIVMLFYMPLARHLVMLRVYWMIHGRLQTIQCIMDSILQRFDYTFLYIYIRTYCTVFLVTFSIATYACLFAYRECYSVIIMFTYDCILGLG